MHECISPAFFGITDDVSLCHLACLLLDLRKLLHGETLDGEADAGTAHRKIHDLAEVLELRWRNERAVVAADVGLPRCWTRCPHEAHRRHDLVLEDRLA